MEFLVLPFFGFNLSHMLCVSFVAQAEPSDYVREQCRIFGVLQTDNHASNAQSPSCVVSASLASSFWCFLKPFQQNISSHAEVCNACFSLALKCCALECQCHPDCQFNRHWLFCIFTILVYPLLPYFSSLCNIFSLFSVFFATCFPISPRVDSCLHNPSKEEKKREKNGYWTAL